MATADLPEEVQPIPQDTADRLKARYVFAALGLLGVALLYALRVNLSVAIVTMVNHTALEEAEWASANGSGANASSDLADTCPGELQDAHTPYAGEFLWDEERQGLMLAAFFWGYAAGQLPGGLLAERLGGKLVFGLGVLITALLTLASPALLWAHELLFFGARLLEGLTEGTGALSSRSPFSGANSGRGGRLPPTATRANAAVTVSSAPVTVTETETAPASAQGVTFPAMQLMIARWAPPAERSRFTMIFSGSYLGTVVTLPLCGLLCDMRLLGGWPLAFYATGLAGALWWLPWQLCVFDSPAEHPRISAAEREFLHAALGGDRGPKERPPVPWRRVLACPGLWACAAMHLGIGWNFFGQITYLPSYMGEVLHYRIEDNAALSAIPYVVGGLSSVASTLSLDLLLRRRLVRPLTGFRIFNGITGLGAAVTLALLPLAGCNLLLINLLLAANGACLGAQYAGNGTNLLVLAPRFAGTLYGLSNTVANAAGILAPYAVGFFTYGNQTKSAWNTIFYISAVVGALTFLIYMVLCSDEEQPWNKPSCPDISSPEKNRRQPDITNVHNSACCHDNSAFQPDESK